MLYCEIASFKDYLVNLEYFLKILTLSYWLKVNNISNHLDINYDLTALENIEISMIFAELPLLL